MKHDKTNLFLASVIILAAISWITSCTHDPNISGLPDVCFEKEVMPIFANNCAISSCHDGGREAMSLTSFADISRGVVPGNPAGSRIYNAITSTWGENKMPPDQPLSLENRTIIRLWIEQGAQDTKCNLATSQRGTYGFLNN